MEIRTNKVLESIHGEPIPHPTKADEKATVGWAIVESLVTDFPDEKLTEADKITRWMLAQRFVGNDRVDVEPGEEVALIKKCVSRKWSITVVNRVFEAINGKGKTNAK